MKINTKTQDDEAREVPLSTTTEYFTPISSSSPSSKLIIPLNDTVKRERIVSQNSDSSSLKSLKSNSIDSLNSITSQTNSVGSPIKNIIRPQRRKNTFTNTNFTKLSANDIVSSVLPLVPKYLNTLHKAVYKNNSKRLHSLMEKIKKGHKDINKVDSWHGVTALHVAAILNRVEMALILLSSKDFDNNTLGRTINIDARDSEGRTPLTLVKL
jgi:ankyrin repeat protein